MTVPVYILTLTQQKTDLFPKEKENLIVNDTRER